MRLALAPIVTSATITAEHLGTYTVNLPQSVVDTYLDAARGIGATLVLHIQPGRAPLEAVIERWHTMLDRADVGVLLDLRPDVAFADQADELDDALAALESDRRIIIVIGARANSPNVVNIDTTLDLTSPGTRFPHDALTEDPHTTALVYH